MPVRFNRLLYFAQLMMLAALFLGGIPESAAAEEKAEKSSETKDASWEYAYEVSVGSAYVWRGLNLLGEGNQHYSPGVYMPSFFASRGAFSLGWASALQLGGANLGRNVDAAAGMEQDFYVEAEKEWKHGLSILAAATLYGFPASRKKAAGADRAAYVEPGAGLKWDWKINCSLKVFWFHGIQETLQTGDYAYLYASASKEWEPVARWTLKLHLEGGRKWYLQEDMSDNMWDVQLNASAKRAVSDSLTLGVQASAAWSNFAGKSALQETALWALATLSLSW